MSEDTELAKDLGLLSALTIGIGTMIGAGIFVLPGEATQAAGPVVVVSFVVGGLIAMVNAMSVSELGTAMPKAGGGYYYVNRALGPLFGSIAGMGDWMGLALASAFYSVGFGRYLADMAPIPGLVFLTDVQVGALVAGSLFVAVNYVGAKETGGVQTVIVIGLLSILGVFAAAGLFSFEWDTVVSDGGAVPMGYTELLPATALVFVSFLGYAKIATVAEELRNPGRNLPIAVIGSVAIVTVLYAILVGIMVGVVPWSGLDQQTPVSQVSEIVFEGNLGIVGVGLISLGALLATASSANASILASARINFAMGRDKIVSAWLNEVHPTFATPYRSILVTGGIIILFVVAAGEDIGTLAKGASVLHLIVYALMNLALIVFREADVPEYDPDFRVPLYPITPLVGATTSLGLIVFMDLVEQVIGALLLVGAIGWFLVYARRNADHEGVLGTYIRRRRESMPDPVVSAAEVARPDGSGPHTVMVALSNPETEDDLLELASVVARANDGVIEAVHVVEVPDQTPLDQGSEHVREIDAESEALLAQARDRADTLGVPVETQTIVSHRPMEEVFAAADRHGADTVVMGRGRNRPWSAGRAEGTIDELAHDLPCDFLVLRDRDLDTSRVLVPTAGGPDSDLSAEVARYLQTETDAGVTLLHVVEDDSERDAGETFLAEWAAGHDLADSEQRVVAGDVEDSIADAARDHSLLIIGATERGLLARLVGDSLVYDVAADVDCSVLLAERPTPRSLWERLFARRPGSHHERE